MTRFFKTLPLALLAGIIVTGCGSDSGSGAADSGKTPGADKGASADTGKKMVVGFSQIGAESAWRTANTKSIQDAAWI
jgi:hypothetical protein